MNIRRWIGKVMLREFSGGGVSMGVSMGIILPMKGKVAKEFIEKSKSASISKETFQKCVELSKGITKR